MSVQCTTPSWAWSMPSHSSVNSLIFNGKNNWFWEWNQMVWIKGNLCVRLGESHLVWYQDPLHFKTVYWLWDIIASLCCFSKAMYWSAKYTCSLLILGSCWDFLCDTFYITSSNENIIYFLEIQHMLYFLYWAFVITSVHYFSFKL